MILAYTKHLSFWIWKTDITAQKIDDLLLKTFKMVIGNFQVIYKFGKA